MRFPGRGELLHAGERVYSGDRPRFQGIYPRIRLESILWAYRERRGYDSCLRGDSVKFLKLEDEFIKHTGLMFFGVGLFNLFSLLYHIFMVRFLPPIEYGHLNTMMALLMVISVPASTIQTTATKFVSSFQVQNKHDRVRELLRHLLIFMSIVVFCIFLLVVLGGWYISSFLRISSQRLIVLLGMTLLFATVLPVPWGGFRGCKSLVH